MSPLVVQSLLELCMLIPVALLPPAPLASGWHLLRERTLYIDDRGRSFPKARAFYWEAPLELWRDHPLAWVAYTPRELACNEFEYVGEAVGPEGVARPRTGGARVETEGHPAPLVPDECD